ncbi:MAG TPA: UDP-N-acetylmuramoyl-tripeptide--D-alanyl-D-alanine ligase [Nitrolancea sp.]|nr:UDP-N-acetylmuramoyl-tripeptide--D-alanyl-D-alanine ligase [Nitrolancea sp.]
MITLRDVLEGTGGSLLGDADLDLLLHRVRHDSRQVEPGDLFVAVVGEHLDGHEFLGQAIERGAGAALVDRSHASALTGSGLPLVVAENTVTALQHLAAYWRALFDVQLVGITGSVGKTSTKEVIAGVLAQRFNTVRSPGSFNNEIGLPLSLLDITPDTDAVVLEIGGAYAPGEIKALAGIARPTIGVVTNVGHAHLERMGSIEAIAATKTELPAALPEDGVAILNGDDDRVRAMADHCRCRVIFYGLAPDCQVRASDIESHGLEGISFTLRFDGEQHHIRVPLLGRHSAHTVLAAIAVGTELGMSIDEMLPGFENPSIQLRLLTVPGIGGSIIIDDTYNASPASCLAALNLLNDLDASRSIAVFGDILELGSFEDEGHRIVGRRAAAVVQLLFTIGPRAKTIAEQAVASGLPASNVYVATEKPELIEKLRASLRPGDIVLVKGSRGMRMEDIVEHLRDQALPA